MQADHRARAAQALSTGEQLFDIRARVNARYRREDHDGRTTEDRRHSSFGLYAALMLFLALAALLVYVFFVVPDRQQQRHAEVRTGVQATATADTMTVEL